MATLTTALDTIFNPAIGTVYIQVNGGKAVLERRNTSGAVFAPVGIVSGAMDFDHRVAGAAYKFTTPSNGSVTVQADQ